ncbi:MAG: cupin domain-containing protein [Melioribacteraceae bacterium]|nr:cupin domain-containing protein [Melioribacteraceae bacterium]MCF8354012.1 cupin domain-containing protein [Melioribacteraceae bacterium]MCF8392307.1 cupin domain-containing protein [Melioribacteraceae bacterium]MCF8417639.1 cupin domain-containing protein [Melioribacteraceae bacterium]
MSVKNIFDDIPVHQEEEIFNILVEKENVKVERIISEGHASPPGFWYDQDKNEMVLLLSGSSEILFDNGNRYKLQKGDYLNIPAHQKHRVEMTEPNTKTIWLAVFY